MEIKIGGKIRFENLLKFVLVGYEVIITNSRYALVGYFITSYPTRAHGIIVKYLIIMFNIYIAHLSIFKCALQHFVMKVGCYVTDDGGNYVTFHELNRRSRKD